MSLTVALVYLCVLAAVLSAQNAPAPAPAQPPQPTQQPPAQPNRNNPFEAVPQGAPATPGQGAATPPQFEAPKAPEAGFEQPTVGSGTIEGIEFRGARRVPQDTLRAMIFSARWAIVYNEETLRRDFMALWNTNRFDDIRLETEKGERAASSCASW